MLTKNDLIGILDVHANNLRIASVLRLLSRGSDLEAEFRKVIGQTQPAGFQPSLLLLGDKPRFIHSVDELYRTIVRTAVTEAFELTSDYCDTTKQTALLQSQPWYHLIKIIRNALNHNFRLEFKGKVQSLLPLSWNTITISRDMEGYYLTYENFPPEVALDWLCELGVLINKRL